MDTINGRINSLIKACGLSTNAFAKKLGKAQSSISIITDGRSKPGFELLELICATFPQVSRDWLLMGEGEMYREETSALTGSGDQYLQEHIIKLEESFSRLSDQFSHELVAKNQQIASLQESQKSLLDMLKFIQGKLKGVTIDPLSEQEIFDGLKGLYLQTGLSHVLTPLVSKPRKFNVAMLAKSVALGSL